MAGVLDFLFGAGPLKAAAGDTSDDNFKAASNADAQRNADYAAKRLGKQPAAPAASSAPKPAPKPITVTKKKPVSVQQGVGSQLMSTNE